jgi:hypothetical protein
MRSIPYRNPTGINPRKNEIFYQTPSNIIWFNSSLIIVVVMCILRVTLTLLLGTLVRSDFFDFERLGAIPHDRSTETAIFNGKLMNETWNNLKTYDVFFVPNKTFHVMGGIYARGWRHVVIRIDGTIKFSDDRDAWPRDENGNVLECMHLSDIEEVKFTSGGKGEDSNIIIPQQFISPFFTHRDI